MASYTYEIDSSHFNLRETLECGQCFHFTNVGENEFIVVAFNKALHIKQEGGELIFLNTDEAEFNSVWKNYFDLERDYKSVKEAIASSDEILQRATGYATGIRILNQEIFECIISFILSQNNMIAKIKKSVKGISQMFGKKVYTYNGEDYYSFPTAEELKDATEQDFSKCLAGFRARYIVDAVEKINTNKVAIQDFNNMTTPELKETLMSIKGIGDKVSDCILLYSCGRTEVFPTDVWVKRVMQYFYYEGRETPIKEIHAFATEKFGANAGFAQQYLFHLAREEKIGK